VLRHGLCKGGPLARDFGVKGEVLDAVIHVKSRTAGRAEAWALPLSCQ
jgi:hypothetical protein